MNNRIYNLIIVLILTAYCSVVSAQGVQVRLNSQARLSEKVVTIGSIAWINCEDQALRSRLESMIVAEKGQEGNGIAVSSFDIAHCLSRAGINPMAVDIYGASECRVSFVGPAMKIEPRPAVAQLKPEPVTEPQASIQAELDRYVANTTGYAPDRLVIKWECSEDGLLNTKMDKVRYEVKPQRSVSLGNVRFMVTDKTPTIPADVLPQHEKFYNKPKTFYVNGYVQYLSEYVVANRDMKAGEIIAAEDVKMVPQLVSMVGQVGVSAVEAVVGKELVRGVSAESVIKGNMVKRLMLVERNAPVYIRYNNSAISITTKGQAMEEGGLNDVVAVKVSHAKTDKNPAISQVLYCRIIASGEVLVVDENMFGNNARNFSTSVGKEGAR